MATGKPYSAIIMAGGAHRRFGEASPLKEKVGGISVLSHGLDVFDTDEDCSEIIISAHAEVRQWIEGDLLTFASTKLKLVDATELRQQSLRNALEQAGQEIVLVHDANRPNISHELIDSIIDGLRQGMGSVPALYAGGPAAYITTMEDSDHAGGNGTNPAEGFFGEAKRKRTDKRIGHLMEHIDRDGLVLLQSPQAYYRSGLLSALDRLGERLEQYDEESAPFVAAGGEVVIVEGRSGNIAIVTQADLKLLIKLMGLPTQRPKKDKYGGLGW